MSAHIHAAVYRKTRRHSNDLVHQENISGSIQQQIEAALVFVDRFMMKPAKKDVGREDFPQYRLGAVLEAFFLKNLMSVMSVVGAVARVP